MNTIPKYNSKAIEYIEAVQKQKLSILYGPFFEENIERIFPKEEDFLLFIEKRLEEEFQDNFDERFEIEAQMKNSATDEVTNCTKYEFKELKTLLNYSELKYRGCAPEELKDKIPYNATVHSDSVDAEIISFPELDKPIIFFDAELFSANLMFCKLYIQLISDTPPDNNLDRYDYFQIKSDEKTLNVAAFCAIYFYNHYFSGISKACPSYDLKTTYENNLLAIFLNTISYYIYCHEVGHYVLGHSNNMIKIGTEELWKDELEADAFAMNRLADFHQADESSTILTFLGPIIFYRFLMLQELYKPAIGSQNTHPPTYKRLELYWAWLFKRINPSDKENLFNFLNEEQKLFEVLTSIFSKIHKEAKRQHKML